jgi:hypothetical protein
LEGDATKRALPAFGQAGFLAETKGRSSLLAVLGNVIARSRI